MRLRLPRWSLTAKLAVLFVAVTALAFSVVIFVFLPRLEVRLQERQLNELKKEVASSSKAIQRADGADSADDKRIDNIVRGAADRANARVTLLGIQASNLDPPRFFVVSDSNAGAKVDPNLALAQKALGVAYGTKPRTVFQRTNKAAQAAKPLFYRKQANWIVLYSRSYDDVADAVKLVRERLLQASALALAVTLLASFIAARMVTGRVRRVERAARALAEGHDVEPIKMRSRDEIGSLASAFNEMQERLKQVDRARREFIANASHELRTPIFSLAGFVELLQDEEIDEPTRAEFLATMHEQVDRLQKLAVDLLDLSRMDAGSLRLETEDVDIGMLATEIAAEFRPVEAQHGAPVELALPGEPVDAVCDRERVAQIMRILIDNALRHTPAGTPVSVGAARRGSVAEFSVSDSGPGIDPSTRGQLFERFYTGDKARGSGLGLAIAKELAERMNGRIRLDSEPGHTTFALELPGSETPVRDPQPAAHA